MQVEWWAQAPAGAAPPKPVGLRVLGIPTPAGGTTGRELLPRSMLPPFRIVLISSPLSVIDAPVPRKSYRCPTSFTAWTTERLAAVLLAALDVLAKPTAQRTVACQVLKSLAVASTPVMRRMCLRQRESSR